MNYWFWKKLLGRLSPVGNRCHLHVFIFHRVLQKPDSIFTDIPDAQSFEWMVKFIAGCYNVLSFGDAIACLRSGTLPNSAACITFDDGYRDNATIALPILKKYGVPATFFISTMFIDGGRMWNDDIIEAIRSVEEPELNWEEFGLGHHMLRSHSERATAIEKVLTRVKYMPHLGRSDLTNAIAGKHGLADKSELMMTRNDILTLRRAGMEIGGHTHSHPILSGISEAAAIADIERGKNELEAILNEPIFSFAYPNGNTSRDLTERDAQIVRRLGFRAAATTDQGVASSTTNSWLIPRFTPWDRTPLRFAARCASAQLNGSPSPLETC